MNVVRRLPRRDRLGSVGNRREVILQRFMSLRLVTSQGKRRDEVDMAPGQIIRSDCDRPAGPFDRLTVVFQPEIAARFPV